MSTALFLNILPHATNYAVDVPSPRETVELLHLIILMALVPYHLPLFHQAKLS